MLRLTTSRVSAVLLTLALTACDGGRAAPETPSLGAAHRPVPGGSTAQPYTHLRDLLPNVRYGSQVQPTSSTAVTDHVALGTLTRVEEGAGFVETGTPPVTGRAGATTTSHGDPAAHWRSVVAFFAVERVLSGAPVQELAVSIPLMDNAERGLSAAAAAEQLSAPGRLLLLTKQLPTGVEHLGLGRVFPDLPFTLGAISDGDSLAFPLLTGADGQPRSETFAGALATLADLEAALREPTVVRRS